MRQRLPFLSLVVTALALLVAIPSAAWATVYIDITAPSERRFPLALPELVAEGSADPQLARQLLAVIERDLSLTNYFELLPRASFIERPGQGGLRMGEFVFSDWSTVGAVGLVKIGYTIEDGRVRAEVRIYDVDAQTMLVGKAFTAGTGEFRAVGHKIANEILYQFTGSPGFFDTRLVCVGNLSGNKEIYVMGVDGADMVPITRNGSINLSPAWSPTGDRIAYTSFRDANPDLWLYDLASDTHRKISSREGVNSGAAFSPDGGTIALTLSDVGDSEIFAVDARSGELQRRLTNSWGIDVNPIFSPDGSRIAFESSRNGVAHIFVMPANGGPAQQVTTLGRENVSPSWSPDGTRLAFAGRDTGQFDVFVLDLTSGTITRITQDQGDNEDPTWSPDGRFVVFSSTRSGSSQLYIADALGMRHTRITNGRGSYTNPQWGPAQ